MKSISFFAQVVPNRPAWQDTKKHLEASDIGEFEVIEHLEGDTPRETFLRTLDAMYASESELVVRFEDDLSGVNKHLKKNILRWPEVFGDHRFGLGWLLAPGGCTQQGTCKRIEGPYHVSCGVVMHRKIIPELKKHCIEHFAKTPEALAGVDLAMGHAAQKMGKQILVHCPSLVAHAKVPSVLGHEHHNAFDYDNGSFKEGWMR